MPVVRMGNAANRTNDQQTIGYDFATFQGRLNKIAYWRQETIPFNSIDPALSKRIDPEKWNRSLSSTRRLSGNHYVWGPLTEVENLPVANTPNSWSQQYIQVPVNGTSYTTLASSLRTVPSTTPIAYNQQAIPSKPFRTVMAIQKNQLSSVVNQSAQGSTFFSWVKMMLLEGGGSNV